MDNQAEHTGMIERLSIRDFAIVDQLDIEWAVGLNVITGETGAGKSILVDAIGALLGDKVGAEVVRTGASRALVEGVFAVEDSPSEGLKAVLTEYGVEVEDGALIVSREIAASGGRGGARVNGRSVPLAVLQALGEQLVDIHGQSQHMALLRPREQLDYLDRYAGLYGERQEVARLVQALRQVRGQLADLRAEERQALREHELLGHEIAEIEQADPTPGEEEALRAQEVRLQNAERLRTAVHSAHESLIGGDSRGDETAGALEALGRAVQAASEAARYDPNLQGEVEALTGAIDAVDTASRNLRRYLDGVEEDPTTLEAVAGRLLVLAGLRRKFGDTLEDVMAYLADARHRRERFEHREEEIQRLVDKEQSLSASLTSAAVALSGKRRDYSGRLSAAVETELQDLGMGRTRVEVALRMVDEEAGVRIEGRQVACGPTGVDLVELLIAPNAGEEAKPMVRIASGGELARVALALKTILARAETRGTLIFDEVDAGVGGRTAPVVGAKLAGLAGAGYQVLCVTHMPQVAAYADCHWVVQKLEAPSETRTGTAITALDQEGRVRELAAMLAGVVTETAERNAEDLLRRARGPSEEASRGISSDRRAARRPRK